MEKMDLKRVAWLSRLGFEEKDLAKFESQVLQILKFVEELKEVNVDGVEPTSHPLPLSNVFRKDEVQSSLKIEEFLKTTPRSRGRFFEVPKIIEDKS